MHLKYIVIVSVVSELSQLVSYLRIFEHMVHPHLNSPAYKDVEKKYFYCPFWSCLNYWDRIGFKSLMTMSPITCPNALENICIFPFGY